MSSGWKEDRFLARWEKEFPDRIKARCGSTHHVHRGKRRTRFWVRVVRDGAVLLFSDGFFSPEEAMGWADAEVADWLADAEDAREAYMDLYFSGRS